MPDFSVVAASAPADAATTSLETRPLTDRDLLDEHRLRHTRLGVALRRGPAPERPGAGRGHVLTGVVLTLVALGGTAISATVAHQLTSPSSASVSTGVPSAPAGGPVRPDSPASHPAPAPAGGGGTPAPVSPDAVPYSPWAQNRSHTTR